MRRLSVVVLGICIVFSCTVKKRKENTTAPSREDSLKISAVESLLNEYYSDMSNRDWPKYRNYFWDNATITTAWKQPGDSAATVDVTTIDDFIKETPNGPDSKPVFEEKMTGSQIKVQGNIAEAWVKYAAKFGTADSLMQWTGTDVFTLLQHDGEWKIVSLVFEADQ